MTASPHRATSARLRGNVFDRDIPLRTCNCVGMYRQSWLAPPEPVLRTVSGGTTAVTDFERVVDDSMRKANVSGLSVAILNDRKVIYTRQFGWKDKDAATRLGDATVFAAASLSKTIFAYVVLLLVDEGLIDLDKPLQGYLPKPLPEYPNYADLRTDDRYRAITARMVLSHTSGLPNVRSETDEQLRIAFQPGSRFSYSGVSFQLLQFVVETVTKSDLETLLTTECSFRLGCRIRAMCGATGSRTTWRHLITSSSGRANPTARQPPMPQAR